MSNLAIGNFFCLATPHYKSTLMGVNEYLNSHCLPSAAFQSALSLTHNLPHLCGFGGDAIIMHKNGSQFRTYNGTGKTGTHQHAQSYHAKQLSSVPRRGVYSTMVYGCPAAYQRFVQDNDINLERLTDQLIVNDLRHGVVRSPALMRTYENARREIDPTCGFKQWGSFLEGNERMSHGYEQTIRHLARNGFQSFYKGDLAAQVHASLSAADPDLYEARDFSDFTPNSSESRRISFMGSTITAHGANSPWQTLFLLLNIYEMSARTSPRLLPGQLYSAAGLIDDVLANNSLTAVQTESMLGAVARAIFDTVSATISARPTGQPSRQAHTIVLACADADGHLISITNSIFTPPGALFEVKNTGILLSNRCHAFNQAPPTQFKARSAVSHTNNCVHVETDELEFLIGTSGGPVQSQTLALIINAVVTGGQTVHDAIQAPQYANMGVHAKTQQVCYLCDGPTLDERFQSAGERSEKLGIVQAAGRNKRTGMPFAVADCRGSGVAIGL
jgi:gamma-glutamyltranspeptidase